MTTDFLFAQPSFLTGAARTLDLFGQFDTYNVSRTPAEADRRALASDWYMVRSDFIAALAQLIAEEPELLEQLEHALRGHPLYRKHLGELEKEPQARP